MMRISALAAAVAVGIVLPVTTASPASAAPGDPTVSVVHGIAEPIVDVVDIYVDETKLDDVAFGSTLRTPLPIDRYRVGIAFSDSTSSDEVLPFLTRNLDIAGDTSVVAQVDEVGFPVLESYRDDLSATAAGSARVVVRHGAAAGPVTINADGAPVVTDLRNGESASLEVAAGSYTFEAVSGTTPVEGLRATLDLEAGTVYTVYAVGGSFLEEEVPGDPELASKVAEMQADVAIEEVPAIDEDVIDEDGAIDEDELFEEVPYSLVVNEYEAGEKTTGSATSTTSAAASTTRPAIPTAVPAGDGTSGWFGPLGVPAVLAIVLAAGLAVAAGSGLRGSTHRR